MKNIFKFWLPVAVWCSLIFYLSSIPNLRTEFGFGDLILRKCAHMTEYGILYLLARRAFVRTTAWQPTVAAFVFAVLYAASDEFHQSFVPTRGPSVRDVMIDAAGAYIAMRVWRWILRLQSPGRIAKTLISVLGVCLVLILAGCGPNHLFKKAQKLEKTGYAVEAGIAYDTLAKKYPQDPNVPEAIYRVGRIYQQKLRLLTRATQYYRMLLDTYPKAQPWAERAANGLLTSPDYFPLHEGNFWIEGDSETGGVNMRAEWQCHAVSSDNYLIARRISAGSHFVSEIKRWYRREGLQLCQYAASSGGKGMIMLAYPFEAGRSWRTISDGQTVEYKIEQVGERVTVKAGSYPGCLKVSERMLDFPRSIKYNYYAPEVGWVLTTTAFVGGSEHRSTELLSYKVFPDEY